MSKEKNLFQLLKPEAKKNLVRNRVQFEVVIDMIIENLKRNYNVSDLTIRQVNNIYLFSDVNYPESPVEAMYCEPLFFQNDEELNFNNDEE
jgi:hypothetical protein